MKDTATDLSALIAQATEPLPDIDDPAFGALFDRYGDGRVVLLGEASHGTSEFYRARAAITERLIEHHGFTIVAVEADWPDAAVIDRHVRHRPPRDGADPPFQRFPFWMWRNREVADLLAWMRRHNEGLAPDRMAGFFGLDMYNMGGSIAAVLDYLDRVDPEAAEVARDRYGCLHPWHGEPARYGRAVLTEGYRRCEKAVTAQWRDLLEKRLAYAAEEGGDAFLDAERNARLVSAAERYYRIMYHGDAESWNLRDSHMFETLQSLLDARGPDSKAVVWAHNSHIGDASHTDMGRRGEHNIGQLCRQWFGDEAALIGFGTHTGTVAAATDWDGDMEVKRVRPSRPDSYEGASHASGVPRFLLDLRRDEALARALEEPRLERFIGVIYRPETERFSHYAEAELSRQFDAWVWFDETTAVTPLGLETHEEPPGEAPETFPFGL